MSSNENSKPSSAFRLNCILTPEVINNIVESVKQFILSVENEADIKETGLFNIRDTLVREISDKYSQISYIRQICIEDHYLVSHSINTATLATLIGLKIGLRQDDLKKLALAALVHDVGKIKIPYQVILKGSKKSPKEQELYRLHVPLGFKIARDEIKLDNTTCRIILEHHERIDGSGYPRGLRGSEIHDFSKIIAVVDTFDLAVNKSLNPDPMKVGEIAKEMFATNEKFSPQALHSLVHMIRYSDQ